MRQLQCLLYKNDCYIANRYITPTRIVVHSTGANNSTIRRYVQPHSEQTSGMAEYSNGEKKYTASEIVNIIGKNSNGNDWNRSGIAACVNAFIGKLADGSIATVQTLPWKMRPWGVGSGSKGSFNNCAIQFEICEDDLTNATYFNSAFKEAIELCAMLCRAYNIAPSMIVSHAESCQMGYGSNHGDPDHWLKKFGKNMDWFRAEVEKLISSHSEPSETGVIYRVQVGAFAVKANADAYLKKVQDAGFKDAFITKVNK